MGTEGSGLGKGKPEHEPHQGGYVVVVPLSRPRHCELSAQRVAHLHPTLLWSPPQGYVTLREFKAGVPPLGPNGEAAKEYIFNRVDSVVDGDGKLDAQVGEARVAGTCLWDAARLRYRAGGRFGLASDAALLVRDAVWEVPVTGRVPCDGTVGHGACNQAGAMGGDGCREFGALGVGVQIANMVGPSRSLRSGPAAPLPRSTLCAFGPSNSAVASLG